MLCYRTARITLAAVLAASLSWTSLLAEEPYKWPEKLPDSVTKLSQTERPNIPKETGLSKEFGLELLTKALRPDTSLKSGIVLIEREKFLPERMHAGRVPLIKIRLFFDRQVKPALWAQWTDGMKKQCAFIRGNDASYLCEQFPTTRSRQSITKRKVDYVPTSQYCDEFPLFSFTYVPHTMMDRPRQGEHFVKRILEGGIEAVEKDGENFYLVHKTGKITHPKSKHSEFHMVWWITTDEPYLVVKTIGWMRLAQSGEWKVNHAFQNEYEKIEGIHVPKVYESYLLTQKPDEHAERIRFSWKDVNTLFPPEMFSDDLLEPKANSLLFDLTEKSDGVIGVPYGTLKKKKSTSE